MQNVFFILGYGVPKDILQDSSYNFYLKIVFNKIYSIGVKDKEQCPLIICSGGQTDMFKPYKRTEAEEMTRLLKTLSQRDFLKKLTKGWIFISEKESLSTLENLLNCKTLLKNKKIKHFKLHIFCEETREKRIKTVARKIFDKKDLVQVIPIDFDTAPNRYLDPSFLLKKEKMELKHSLWALQSSENLKKHHELFQEKITRLRKGGSDAAAIKKWWEERLKKTK